MTLHLNPRDTFVATCSCGKRYTRGAWERLPLCGYMRSASGGALEMRHCPCGSTRSVELAPDITCVRGCLLFAGNQQRHRWERSVKEKRWGGRMHVVCVDSRWFAEVVFRMPADNRTRCQQADHADIESALEHAIEDLNLPDDFLAAFARLPERGESST